MRPVWILVALAACERATPPDAAPEPQVAVAPAPHELAVTMARSACYGWCPVYELAIYRDGVVEYTGEQYVTLRGRAIGHVTTAQLALLDRLFADAHYFDLADHYTFMEWSDMPTVTTMYQLGARAKRIEHYHGDGHAPEVLGNLEDAIDQMVAIEQFIGTREQREQHAQDER